MKKKKAIMMRKIIILTLFLFAFCFANKLKDSIDFGKKKQSIQKDIRVEWSYQSDKGLGYFEFEIAYPKIKANNIETAVFLQREDNFIDISKNIKDFNPSFYENYNSSFSRFYQKIDIIELDDKNGEYNCPRKLESNGQYTLQTCFGYFAVMNKGDLKKDESRANKLKVGMKHSYLHIKFKLQTRFPTKAGVEVTTKILTKIAHLPCVKTGECVPDLNIKL